jgi:hypothetical protein
MLKQDKKLVCTGDGVQTADSNSTVTAVFDTVGFARAVVDVWYGAAATTNGPAVCKLEEGDTTSSFSAITALTGGGVGGFTIAAAHATTSTPNAYRFDVDLRGRKRYLKVSLTPSTAQATTVLTCVAKADLYHAALDASSATGQGVNQLVTG